MGRVVGMTPLTPSAWVNVDSAIRVEQSGKHPPSMGCLQAAGYPDLARFGLVNGIGKN